MADVLQEGPKIEFPKASDWRLGEGARFEPPSDVARMIVSERINLQGKGPPLPPKDDAHLSVWRKLPDPADKQYCDLMEGRLLFNQKIGPPLSPGQNAKLDSKLDFREPADEKYRQLDERRLRRLYGVEPEEPPLSSEEEMTLGRKFALERSKILFPDRADEIVRSIAERAELAQMKIGPPPSPKDMAKLESKLDFPDRLDESFRALAEAALEAKREGKTLSREDSARLESKIDIPSRWNEPYRKLLEKLILDKPLSLSKKGKV
jgi:hypothetical protein